MTVRIIRHAGLAAILLLGCEKPLQPSVSPSPAPEPVGASDDGLEPALADAVVGVSDEELKGLLREHWGWRLERGPVGATELGVHAFDDRIADVSTRARDEARAKRKEFLERAKAIDSAGLGPADRLSLRLFIEQTEYGVASEACRYAEWNLSARSNPVTGMNRLPQVHQIHGPKDAANLLARYRQVPKQIHDRIENLKAGAGDGLFANAESARRVIAMAKRQIDQPITQWPLLDPAEAQVQGLSAAERDEFMADITKVATEEIQPALQAWHDFLTGTVLPKARDDSSTGLAALPLGPACYDAMIRQYTTLPLTAEEIHETGLRELKRINDEMRTLGKKLFGTKTLKKTLGHLREDKKLYFDTEEAVEQFAAESLAAAKAKMPEYFGILPKADCVVTRVPEYEAPFTTIAYYEPAFPDGSKPGEYFINTTAPTTRPRYEARVLAHHEAIPGHHLQIAIAQELPEVPAFRRHGGRTVFVEGWALYTERLSDEMGLYRDDLDRMGVLSFDAWRAGRLVVDTGIHAKGWSRKQAVDYLVEHTALAPNNVDNEVDRYISWPGQALGYKIGQLEILALRARAEKALGEKFDIKAFHDTILGGGAVSVEILRERVDAWIAAGSG